MEDLSQVLNNLAGKTLRDTDVTPAEIPEIDLYIDQIITLVENKAGGSKRRPTDKLLTKAMVNNYSKEGLIKALKGKRYSREHIVQILLIYNLKQTLSIQDVKTVLAAAGEDETQITALYERFLCAKSGLREDIPVLVNRLLEGAAFEGLEATDQTLLLVLMLSSLGGYLKRLSEDIIDNCL